MNSSDPAKLWEERAQKLEKEHPLKVISHFPKIPHVTTETEKKMRWKGLKYLIKHDQENLLWSFAKKHPLLYLYRLIKSYLKKRPFYQENDFFYYGIRSDQEWIEKSKNSLVVIGFSYCHKPFECPSGRFSSECMNSATSPVCGQCRIGKLVHLIPSSCHVVWIPTIHAIGKTMFDLQQKHPNEQILFLISACELSLRMFADWGNMLGLQGIGVRLQGRICNTMEAFELSERGIKPGLTVIEKTTEERVVHLITQLAP